MTLKAQSSCQIPGEHATIKKQKVFIYFHLNISTFSAACVMCWSNPNSAISLTPQILGLKAVLRWLQTSVKQPLFSLWLSGVVRVKEVGTATGTSLEGTSLHTCPGDPCMVCVPWHPSGHLRRSSGPGSILFARLFYPKWGEAGKSRTLLKAVERLLVLPHRGGTLPAPDVICSLSQRRILLLGLPYGRANFIFLLN